MHPRIDQLLSLRDGLPVEAATREHVESCAACTASLRRLSERRNQLQSLPQFDPPDIDYTRIRDRAAAISQPAKGNDYRRGVLAAAAVVAAVIAGFAAMGRYSEQPTRARRPVVPAESMGVPGVPHAVPQDPGLAQLVERSRELDRLLQTMPPRPEVQRVSLAGTVDRLEQRVQWLDMQLSSVPEVSTDDALSRRMWRERVDLMDSLVAVRYAESLPRSAFPSEPPG